MAFRKIKLGLLALIDLFYGALLLLPPAVIVAAASSSFSACSTTANKDIEITTASDVITLNTAVNCSGGTVHALWYGTIAPLHEIHVGPGTTLNITAGSGEGTSDAIISGASLPSGYRIFQVFNGILRLHDVSITDASSIGASCGGALLATDVSKVYVDGTSTISHCSSDWQGGAFCIVNSSSLVVDGSASFSSNSVFGNNDSTTANGGAIFASSRSTVTVKGDASIRHNNASNYGAGIYVEEYSILYVTDRADLSYNYGTGAGVYKGEGGAVALVDYSNAYFSGSASIHNNRVEGWGAGIKCRGVADTEDVSTHDFDFAFVYMSENVTAVDNYADQEGGVASLDWGCSVVISDNVVIARNEAGLSGGAFVGYKYVNFRISGDVSFTDNTAVGQYGGALKGSTYINYYISDRVQFINNWAQDKGGAIYDVFHASIEITGDVLFMNNTAGTEGGALIAIDTIELTISGRTDQSVRFIDNTAGSQFGGAISFTGTTAHISQVLFLGNEISTGSGGALSAGSASTVNISDSKFSFNTGQIGGALTASEAAVTAQRVSFINNTALASGGASSVSSASQLSCSDCSFSNNSAVSSGGGVYWVLGDNSDFRCTDCAFEQNIATCCSVSYAEQQQARAAGDPFKCEEINPHEVGSYCCQDTAYINDDAGCTVCDSATTSCSSLGITLKTLPLRSGRWRASLNSTDIAECLVHQACVGGAAQSSTDDYCAAGYHGILCAECTSGYSHTFGHQCKSCQDGRKVGVSIAIAIVLLICVGCIVCFISDLLSPPAVQMIRGAETAQEVVKATLFTKFLGKLKWRYLRAPIIIFQILTGFIAITGIQFPAVYSDFLEIMSILSMDFSWLLRAGCLVSLNFYDELLIVTLMPLAIIAIAVSLYLAIRRHILRKTEVKAQSVFRSSVPKLRSASPGAGNKKGVGSLEELQHPISKTRSITAADCSLNSVVADGGTEHDPVLLATQPREEKDEEAINDDILQWRSKYGNCATASVKEQRVLAAKVQKLWLKKLKVNVTSAVTLVLYLIYATTSSVVFATFACDSEFQKDLGESFLRADYSIHCDSSTHRAFMVYAGFCVVIYPIGIPLAFLYMLCRWFKQNEEEGDGGSGGSGGSGGGGGGSSGGGGSGSGGSGGGGGGNGEEADEQLLGKAFAHENETAAVMEESKQSAIVPEPSTKSPMTDRTDQHPPTLPKVNSSQDLATVTALTVASPGGKDKAESRALAASLMGKLESPSVEADLDRGGGSGRAARIPLMRTTISTTATTTTMYNVEKPVNMAKVMLTKDYKDSHRYWEILEFLRRLLLTGLLVFMAPGTASQAAIACVFATIFLVVGMMYNPFGSVRDTQVYVSGCIIILLSMFLALLVKVNIAEEDPVSQDIFSVLLITLNVVLVAMVVWNTYTASFRDML